MIYLLVKMMIFHKKLLMELSTDKRLMFNLIIKKKLMKINKILRRET
jgi:hypothetical protein